MSTYIADDFSDEEIEKLRKKVDYAHEWAKKHFNFNSRLETRLIDDNYNMFPPSFFVEFPEPDKMLVSPSFMGTPMKLWIPYVLVFKLDGRYYWQGFNPLTKEKYPPLWIE